MTAPTDVVLDPEPPAILEGDQHLGCALFPNVTVSVAQLFTE